MANRPVQKSVRSKSLDIFQEIKREGIAVESSEWRVFVAVPVPDSIKRWIQSQYRLYLKDEERMYKRRTEWQDYHITVQFLGNVAKERISSIVEQMKLAACKQRTFELRLGTWDTFGLPHAPRVLWLGVEGERQQLDSLQQQVTAHMSHLGFIAEKRPYHPHITVARKYPGSARFDLDKLRRNSSSAISAMPSISTEVMASSVYSGSKPSATMR